MVDLLDDYHDLSRYGAASLYFSLFIEFPPHMRETRRMDDLLRFHYGKIASVHINLQKTNIAFQIRRRDITTPGRRIQMPHHTSVTDLNLDLPGDLLLPVQQQHITILHQ